MRTIRSSNLLLFVAVVLLLCTSNLSLQAQENTSSRDSDVDEDVIRLKLEEVEASTSLDESLADSLLDSYRKALTNLERARVEKSAEEAFVSAGASAEQEQDETLIALEEMRRTDMADELEKALGSDNDELEKILSDQRVALNEAEVELARLRERYTIEVARPAQARTQLAEARIEYEASLAEANSPGSAGEPSAVEEARRWHQKSRAQRLAAEIRKLQQEILTYEARFALLESRLDFESMRVERLRAGTRLLEDAISERRAAEAEQARRDAVATSRELEDQHPSVAQLAARNVELSEHLTERTQEIQIASDERDAGREEYTRILEEYTATRNKLAVAGLNQALGQVLVNQRRALPNPATLKKQSRERERKVADVGLEQIQLGEQRREMLDVDNYVDSLLEETPSEEREFHREELTALVRSRIELIDQALESGARYLRVLGELELEQRQLFTAVSDYLDFLDGKLLWVRNTAPIGLDVFASLPADTARLLSASNWSQFRNDFTSSLKTRPWLLALFALLFVLALGRVRFLRRVDSYAKNVNRIRSYRFADSLWALAYTLLAAAPVPIALAQVGSMAASNLGAAPFSEALGSALMLVAGDLLLIWLFIDAGRPDGLLRKHCNWPDEPVDKLCSELRWFLVVFPLARLIGVTSYQLDAAGPLGGLAVLGSVSSGLFLALLIFRLFTPEGGILRDYLQRHPQGALNQTRPVWLGILLAVMPLLVILWLAGYNYTGQQLAFSFKYSFWLVLGLLVLQSLLTRWLMFGYQRLEINALIEQRDTARAAAEDAADMSRPEETDLEVEEPEIDFDALNTQSRFLLNTIVAFVALTSLWLIWAPVIPALGILEEVSLWTRSGVVKGETAQVPVTLMDLLLAVIVGVAAGVLARGLPSLLELMLLNRTNMSSGDRYTATTLLRYTIIGAGAIIVINMLGVSWSKAQWLVAALGVGIGFGLQEIVANFISGLVILFERPIRVGDIVTVGETSGVVTRIQIRATTIRDWDRRELLVPNKEFITGRLLNWSLSDNVLRLVIPVGIAYEGDVEKAMQLMEEAAREHENVLEDPAPFVIFEEFGDNSLNLTLRAYLPSVEYLLTTKSALHISIRAKLADAGITIAFPQRDVHLDTSEPLDIRMLRLKGETTG